MKLPGVSELRISNLQYSGYCVKLRRHIWLTTPHLLATDAFPVATA